MKYGEKPEFSYIGQANVMSDDEANDILKNRYKNDKFYLKFDRFGRSNLSNLDRRLRAKAG